MADQRLAAPVLRDESKQPVLDAVPFAGSGRQMGNGDRHSDLVRQLLQLPLPKTHPYAVTATTVRRDQQTFGTSVARPTAFLPPAANTLDGEGSGIVIGNRVAEFWNLEVMHANWLGIAFRSQFPAAILKVAN